MKSQANRRQIVIMIDEESTILLLRELTNEGISYVPFDPEKSEGNWSVKDGTLYGGFVGLKGIGSSKAASFMAARAAGGEEWAKAKLKLAEHEPMFSDVYPTRRRFGDFYSAPEKHPAYLRPDTVVTEIDKIDGAGDFVIVGRMESKDLGDYNEPIRIKRRNGVVRRGPTLFLDLKIVDDTGKILCRVDRFEFEEIGRKIWDAAPINTWWLLRGERKIFGGDSGFKMLYVKRIKQLPEGGV